MSLPTEEMTCQEVVDLVTAYFEGALPAPDRARFEAHLSECPYCGIYLDQMCQTIRLLGRLTEDELSPEVRTELLHRFRDWKTAST